jgi:GDP-L-fucose synthase
MKSDSRIFVAGHTGLVGSAIVRCLENKGYKNILTADRGKYDLSHRRSVDLFYRNAGPEYVFIAAAKVGGILANSTYKGDFLYQNLMIQTNLIDISHRYDVRKVLFLGSSCIYPKDAKVPISEESLMTGPLEETNDAYAIAKIAGIKLCQSYRDQYNFKTISLMPTNLYGINDNFNLKTSHVLPALISKIHDAKINDKSYVECWGDGTPMREFLHVDDLADACHFCMMNYDSADIINVGTGIDITIRELTEKICDVIGYNGSIVWNESKPNGTMRKVLNVSKINKLGWKSQISLDEGLKNTYEWYKQNIDTVRIRV